MRATKSDCVAATQSRITQHIQPNTLPCADRPAPFVGGHVLFGPHAKARPLLLYGIFDAFGGIRFYELCLACPPEKTAHCVEEVPRLVGCLSSTFAARHDGHAGNSADRLRAGGLDHLLEDILSLPSGCRRQSRPAGGFAIAPDQPSQ